MKGREAVVRVVNRVVDDEGKPVRWEAMAGGEALWVDADVWVPVSVARIIIHQSMYKMDPVTSRCEYRLGCDELHVPTDPLNVAEVTRTELIDRDLLPGRTELRKIHNPIRRHEPMQMTSPGLGPGSHAGTFGEVKA